MKTVLLHIERLLQPEIILGKEFVRVIVES